MAVEGSDPDTRRHWFRGTWAKLRWWDAVFLATACAVMVTRFVVLRGDGAPPTIDAANWLAFADGMLGRSGRPSAMVYPPVVPALSGLSVHLFGLVNGVSLLAAISSVAPAAGAYLSLRYLQKGFGALVAGLLLLGASSIGETTAWGGFPQLIGFGLTPVVLLAFDRWLRTWSWRAAFMAGLLFSLMMAVSHFVALTVGFAVIAMLVLALAVPIAHAVPWRKVVLHLGLMVVAVLPMLPIYLLLSAILRGPPDSFLSSHRLTWADVPGEIEFLYRAFPLLWRAVISVLVVTPLFAWGERAQRVWRLLTSLLIGVVAATILVRETRFLYFLTLLGAISVGFWVDQAQRSLRSAGSSPVLRALRSRRSQAALAVLLLAVCGWQFRAGMDFFGAQRDHYGVLTPDLYAAIEYLDETALSTDVLAIPALRDTPVGWWLEAITGRRVFFGSPLRWLAYEDELNRARVANEVFAPGFPTRERLDLAQAYSIRFVLLPKDWTFYDADAVARAASEMPGLIVLNNNDAVVLKLW